MLPVETVLALFPEGRTVKRRWPRRAIRLRPMTLAHAAAMEAQGCGILDGFLRDADALMAAWVLTLDYGRTVRAANGDLGGMMAFAKGCKGVLAEVCVAVNMAVADALKPFVPAKGDGGVNVLKDGLPNGYGWPLEVAEALCSRYGWDFDKALRVPLARALALMAVGRANAGCEAGGPDYYNRIRLERWKRAGVIGRRGKEA